MSRRNRRQFLEDSMFATAATLAAGSPVPLFAETPPRSRSPNEKLGVAVVGVRGRGGSHIGAFAGRRDTQILYVCDVDHEVARKRAKEVAKRQGRRPRIEEDLRRVLEDPRVDVVSIATPNHQHALQSIWAMQAGKDVYVEKPVSHNVSEGRRMVEAARKHGRLCQTGTQCRSNPGMIEAMDFVASGALGDVKVSRGLCYLPRPSVGPRGEYPVPGSVNYDLWLGPAPPAPLTRRRFHYDWHWQWPYGNGDLGNQGVHQMDLARWALGTRELSRGVISYGGRFGGADAGETADTMVVLHDYGNKSLVLELRTMGARGVKVGLIVECTGGYVVMTSYHSGAAFDAEGRKIREFRGGANHFANFLAAVRSRNPGDLNADVEEGHLSSALCHLGNVSYQLGSSVDQRQLRERLGQLRFADDVEKTLDSTLDHLAENQVDLAANPIRLGAPLTFDAASETFPNHSTANAMLTREYRPPFLVPPAGEA